MTDLNSKTEKVEIRLTKSEKERLKQFAARLTWLLWQTKRQSI